jgi:hypothetical protein
MSVARSGPSHCPSHRRTEDTSANLLRTHRPESVINGGGMRLLACFQGGFLHSATVPKPIYVSCCGQTHRSKFAPNASMMRSHRQARTRRCSLRTPVGHTAGDGTPPFPSRERHQQRTLCSSVQITLAERAWFVATEADGRNCGARGGPTHSAADRSVQDRRKRHHVACLIGRRHAAPPGCTALWLSARHRVAASRNYLSRQPLSGRLSSRYGNPVGTYWRAVRFP